MSIIFVVLFSIPQTTEVLQQQQLGHGVFLFREVKLEIIILYSYFKSIDYYLVLNLLLVKRMMSLPLPTNNEVFDTILNSPLVQSRTSNLHLAFRTMIFTVHGKLDHFRQCDFLPIFWPIFGTYYHQVLMVGHTKYQIQTSC